MVYLYNRKISIILDMDRNVLYKLEQQMPQYNMPKNVERDVQSVDAGTLAFYGIAVFTAYIFFQNLRRSKQ
jgi:hypothetical protein